MIGEVDFFGIYLSPLIPWTLIALLITYLVRRLLTLIGLYGFVWHAALFDLALFVLFWAAVSALAPEASGLLQPML